MAFMHLSLINVGRKEEEEGLKTYPITTLSLQWLEEHRQGNIGNSFVIIMSVIPCRLPVPLKQAFV